MRNQIAKFFLLIFLCGFSFSYVKAGEFDVAVVIGNKSYRDVAIPTVDYAVNDAENMAQYFHELMEIPEDNIIKIKNATAGDFVKTFGNNEDYKGLIWQKADPLGRSRIFIYYSGHGYPTLAGGRLLPVDASHNAAALVGYSLKKLITNISKVRASSSILILDSCFSGLTQNGSLIEAASPLYYKKEKYDLLTNMTLITAAGTNEIASWLVEKEQGLFTYHLLQSLYGAGDIDGDGLVKVSEVKKYLDTSMTFDARRLFARSQFAFVSGIENIVLGKVTSLQPPNNIENPHTVISHLLNDEGQEGLSSADRRNDKLPVNYNNTSTIPRAFVIQMRPEHNKRPKKRLHRRPPPRF